MIEQLRSRLTPSPYLTRILGNTFVGGIAFILSFVVGTDGLPDANFLFVIPWLAAGFFVVFSGYFLSLIILANVTRHWGKPILASGLFAAHFWFFSWLMPPKGQSLFNDEAGLQLFAISSVLVALLELVFMRFSLATK